MSVGLWIVIWMGVLVAAILAEVISNAFVSIWFIAGALVLTAVNVIFYYIGVDVVLAGFNFSRLVRDPAFFFSSGCDEKSNP